MRILVLADARELVDCYRRDLRREGYEVLTDEPSPAAVERADRACPDLVILDLQPRGPERVRAMRRLMARCPRIPVLLALEEAPRWDHWIGASADAFVRRSTDTRELRTKVRRLLAPEAA